MKENCFSDAQWQSLDDEIQSRFRIFAAELIANVPGIIPRYGKTVTKIFPLFSHVSFKLNRADDLDVIVGIDISPNDGTWKIDADISEEETGEIYFELENASFEVSSFDELRIRALRAVDALTEGGKPHLLRRLASPVPVPSCGDANQPVAQRNAII